MCIYHRLARTHRQDIIHTTQTPNNPNSPSDPSSPNSPNNNLYRILVERNMSKDSI